jgi:hypothetical protein
VHDPLRAAQFSLHQKKAKLTDSEKKTGYTKKPTWMVGWPVPRKYQPLGTGSCDCPWHSTQLYRAEAVVGAELAQYPVNVVLHRLLGEIQLRGNLLVRQATANHLYQLLFPPSEAEIASDSKMGRLGRLLANLLE